MNFLKKIFGHIWPDEPHNEIKIQTGAEPENELETEATEQIQGDVSTLGSLLRETIDYYKTLGCPCAFPRFIQYTSIDCVDSGDSFFMRETESFIQASDDCFDTKEIDKGNECYRAILTCKTCGSTFIKAWSDFSIAISRTYLKPLELKAPQIGADAEKPIPFMAGLCGHSMPDKAGFKHVDHDTFRAYLRALKDCAKFSAIKIVNSNRELLYDDNQDRFYDVHSIVFNKQRYNFRISDVISLENLQHTLLEACFKDLINNLNFKSSAFDSKVYYRSKEGLSSGYLKQDELIIIVSFGESQPGRYKIFFEGIIELQSCKQNTG